MRNDPGFSSHAAAELSPQIRSFIGVPVVLSGGAFYGTLCAVDPEPRTLTCQQADLLSVLARLVATQIEHQRAEEAIRESGRRIENILESITEEFFAVDREWRYTYLNERALHRIQRVKGERLTREELLGKNAWELYPELVGSVFYRELHRALREQKTVHFEGHSPLSDGWFEVHAYPSEEGLSVYGQDVTERKQAEETSRESEARLRRAIEIETVGVIFFKTDGSVIGANDAFLRMSGYSREDLAEGLVRWDEMTPPEWMPHSFKAIEELESTGRTIPYEKEYVRKDGSRWWALFAATRLDEEESVEFIIDITKSKRSEEALRESEERFRSAFESAPIGMALVSLDGRWLEVNDPVCELLGYSREELLRTNFQELTHPDDLEVDLEHLRRLLRDETRSYRVEKRYIHKKGRVVWGLLSASLVRDAEGAPLYALAQIQDITHSKRDKEELERLNLQNESILKSASEGIFGLDRKRRITLVNPSGAWMLGYEPEELIHRDMHSVTRHTRPDGTPCPDEECPIYAAFEDGSIHRSSDEVFWRKDGSSFPVEYTSTPMEVDGNVVGAVATFRDITERKRAEEALAREVRAKSDFLADVSHELRTPLTVIRGNAEVGLELGRGWAHADLLEEIVEESAMMSRMVEDLLFLARSDSDSLPLDLRTVPVSQLLGGLAKRAETLAREHGASLRVGLGGEGHLRCDAGRIEQAVLVLIDNAAKYGPPGVQVTLSSSTRTDELLIEVADRGPGIPPEELPCVFERFYRCKNSLGEPGSGLGLPIAKTIVKGHGGRIEAASEVGEGTRVSLHLPLINGI